MYLNCDLWSKTLWIYYTFQGNSATNYLPVVYNPLCNVWRMTKVLLHPTMTAKYFTNFRHYRCLKTFRNLWHFTRFRQEVTWWEHSSIRRVGTTGIPRNPRSHRFIFGWKISIGVQAFKGWNISVCTPFRLVPRKTRCTGVSFEKRSEYTLRGFSILNSFTAAVQVPCANSCISESCRMCWLETFQVQDVIQSVRYSSCTRLTLLYLQEI